MDKTQRKFIFGSEWLYYKIYCGPKTCDKILLNIIKPFQEKLLGDNIISEWFFIRYADPDNHIRVRFKLNNLNNISLIARKMEKLLNPYLENNIVAKIQLDTYNRELERYGTKSIEFSERLFFNDSNFFTKFLAILEGDQDEELRWLTSLLSIEEILNDFKFSLNEKITLLNHLQESFLKEHNADSNLRKQLGNKYKIFKGKIAKLIQKENSSEKELIVINLLAERSLNNRPIVNNILQLEKEKNLELSKFDLLSSYIHMLMNRHFRSKNRQHEMVIYNFLFKYYQMIFHCKK